MNNKNNDRDITAASIAVCLWLVAFAIGMVIADTDRACGLLIMASATAIFAVRLIDEHFAEKRIESRDDRLRKYQEDCAQRTQELLGKGVSEDGKK